MKRALALIAVFVLGLIIGFPIGARVGLWQFMLADAQYKASILSTEIKSLRAGKPEPIIVGMEISLNAELSKHGQYMESHFSWLWPELKSEDDKPIRRAVAYRLANPYQGPDHTKPESWNPDVDMNSEFVKEVIEGQKIQKHYIRKVLDHYGSTEPAR
jgi:hypothetical protein